ncbi:clavesin-1-like [Bemisia tabaci]|uniref:clavesin-1-like n=1 Tax=Bemisia tabaci TaxID=7038 RepID=UPI0008F9D7DE|nr:PREDICTED: clavesin-1-like [Bemisia tabaci]
MGVEKIELGENEISQEDKAACLLREELRLVAKTELREDDAIRTHALRQMRDWISKHPDIEYCRTDAPFLLRFLRTKKFCMPLAQEMLERYLTIRQIYPHWFSRFDVLDPTLSAILDSGYLIPLPERDEYGRCVLLACIGKFDPHKYTSADMARVHSMVVELLMDDPENQVRGYTYVNDDSGLSMSHVTLWSLNDLRSIIRCIQNSTPMRHKATHFFNVPNFANKVFDFVVSLMNEKLKNRVTFHSNVDDMKRVIDPKILPREYGGEIPTADLISRLKKQLLEKREELLALDKMKINVRNKKMEFEVNDMAGSFRKLEVD